MEIYFFRNKKKKILEKYRRLEVQETLSKRIEKETDTLEGLAGEDLKNHAEGIKALAEAEKALAEVDSTDDKNRSEARRGVLGLLLNGAKIAVSAILIWITYGLEADKGWFLSNKESGRMASDNLRESTRGDSGRF